MSGTILGSDWQAASSNRPSVTNVALSPVEFLMEASVAPRAGAVLYAMEHIECGAASRDGALGALPNRLLRQGA